MIPRYDKLASAPAKPEPQSAEGRMPVAGSNPSVCLHGKSIVIDGRISLIGTHNFDPRSASFNSELAVVIWDEAVAAALRSEILRDMAPQNSWVVARQKQLPLISPLTGIVGDISRGMPFFDIWPFRYAASFQLRQGATPVPSDHPEFYEHYENVGQFPEVRAEAKAIQAKLFGAMGGFVTPFM